MLESVFFLLTLTFLDCVSCSKILSNSIILRKENIINDVHVRFQQWFFFKNSFQCNCFRTTVIYKALSNLMKNSCSIYSLLKMFLLWVNTNLKFYRQFNCKVLRLFIMLEFLNPNYTHMQTEKAHTNKINLKHRKI